LTSGRIFFVQLSLLPDKLRVCAPDCQLPVRHGLGPSTLASDKSVAIYAWLNPSENSGWVAKAIQQTSTSRTVARMPVIDAHDAAVTFQSAGTYFRATADGVDGDLALKFSRSPSRKGIRRLCGRGLSVEEPSPRGASPAPLGVGAPLFC